MQLEAADNTDFNHTGQHYMEERTIIQHRWVLLPPPSRALHSLCGQKYQW